MSRIKKTLKDDSFFLPDKNLNRILNDKTSGSSELVLKLNRYLSKNLLKIEEPHSLISFLKIHFSTFTTITSYLSELQKIINSGDDSNIKIFFDNYDNSFKSVHTDLYQKIYPVLKSKKKIITISNSRTVKEILKLFKNDCDSLSVIVCESRPKYEGKILAKELAKYKIKVKFITEAMIAANVQEVDAALIGTDMILSSGNVVNKVGSNSLAIICKHYKKPFYVAVDKSKISKRKSFKQQKQNKSEIWDVKNGLVTVDNYYFEEIDKKLVTKIFSN